MIRRMFLVLLIVAIVVFAALGVVSHRRGLWAVIPVGEQRALYVDSFDGICSIGWHSNNNHQGVLGQTTGRWMAGTDLTGKITPYFGSTSSEHEPQIRAKYIDITYVGYLPWLDGGGLGGSGGGNEWWSWYLVVSHWLLVAAFAGLALILVIRGRRRRAAVRSESDPEREDGADDDD